MSFIRSRFFLVALAIAVVLTVFPLAMTALGFGDIVSSGVQTLSYPFRWCIGKVYDGLSGFAAYLTEYDKLKEENESLRAELQALLEAAGENEVLREENRWLRKYLSLKNEHIDYCLLDAAIVGRESTPFATVITLNRGSAHGVAVGMSVITEKGVFGYVKEVSYMSCKVVSIVETATAVGAFVERTGVTGLVEGDYTLREDGRVIMKNIPVGSDLVVGDRVHTGGTGSVYPRGLLIGTVLSISADPYSRTLTAVIEPAEDFLTIGTMSHLMIITAYEIYSEDVTDTAVREGS